MSKCNKFQECNDCSNLELDPFQCEDCDELSNFEPYDHVIEEDLEVDELTLQEFITMFGD